MASGGEDRTIILWDLGSGKKLKTMTGHTGFIYSVCFSSDSTTLVSGSADNTVRAWNVNKNTPYESRDVGSDMKRAKMNGNQKGKKDSDNSKLTGDNKKKGSLER
jgi:transcription initiation factor TFIID subunit 5